MKPAQNWDENTPAFVERKIGYVFRDKQLLKTCFTHKSYAAISGEEDNERLEFLGDSVLQLVVTESLFRREVGDEGSLTERRKQFVSKSALTVAVEKADVLKYLRYAGGEDALRGKTPSNLFEAVVAGIYLDGGMKETRAFLKRFLVETDTENYKTMLQELAQSRGELPVYDTVERESGFFCTVTVFGESVSGGGESKKSAETQAAKQLYQKLSERKE